MPEKQSSPSWLSLSLVFALAALLRIPGLTAQSLWYDEIYSLDMTQWPMTVILTVKDGHPPLYNVLLVGLVPLLGEQAGRILSLVVSLATVPLFMLLAARLFDRRTAVWAGLLLAISPLHIWYSREGRMYALYVLFTVLSSLALERVVRGGGWRAYLGWGFATLGGLLTHYGYAAVLLAQILFGTAVVVRRRGLAALAPVVAIGFVGAGVLLPLARELVLGPIGGQRGFETFALPYTALTFLFGFGIGPSLTQLHWSRSLETLEPYALELGVAVLVMALVALVIARHLLDVGPWGIYAVLWLAAPPILLLTSSAVSGTSANVRYVIGSLPAFLMLLAFALARERVAAAVATAVLIAALSGLSLYRVQFDPRFQREQMREAADFVEEHIQEDDRVVISAASQLRTLNHYFAREGVIPGKVTVRPILGPADVEKQIGHWNTSAPRTWVLLSREWDEDPKHLLRKALLERDPDALRANLAGVDVFLLQR